MRIESGSQNASRITGTYAYPLRKYNTSAVEEVSPAAGRTPHIQRNQNIPETAPQKNPHIGEREVGELNLYSPISKNQNKLSDKASNSRGSYVNLLA